MEINSEAIIERLKAICNRDPSDVSCLGCNAIDTIRELVRHNEELRRQINVMKKRDEKYQRFIDFVAKEMS